MDNIQVQPTLGRASRGRTRDRGSLVLVDDLDQSRPLSSVGLGRAVNKYFCAWRINVLDDCIQPCDPIKRYGFAACLGMGMLLLMIVDYVVRTVRGFRVWPASTQTYRSRTSSWPRHRSAQVEERDGRVGEHLKVRISGSFSRPRHWCRIDAVRVYFPTAIYLVGGYR